MVKVYVRVDHMSWRQVDETPGAIVARTENLADGPSNFEDGFLLAACVLVPLEVGDVVSPELRAHLVEVCRHG